MKLTGCLGLLLVATASALAGPSGAPGIPHRWAPARKQAVGTAYEETGAESPVWFTLSEGILTEVFYPTVDAAQVGDLQLLITDGEKYFSEQKRDTDTEVAYSPSGSTVQVRSRSRDGRYSLEQEYATDAHAPVLRIRTTIRFDREGYRVHVLFKPAVANAGARNLGSADSDGLYATSLAKSAPSLALLSSLPWRNESVGYVGFSDGWQDLSKNFHMTEGWREAGPGNIALTGELRTSGAREVAFELALGFGQSREQAQALAQGSLLVPFSRIRQDYDSGWNRYLSKLRPQLPLRSAQVIKMHEDKLNRGAIVASLSKPAVPDGDRAQDGTGGYHLVWPRDLYHGAMGLLAAGDTQTPREVLRFLVGMQSVDGSWPQNFWVNGTPYWRGLQMDEVAVPILLARHLVDKTGYALTKKDLDMVGRAADFLIAHGPATPQDRWEEIGGYVPATLAAEIAGLKAAAALTGTARYSQKATEWSAKLEQWTVVAQGPHGNDYFLRVSPSGHPDQPEAIGLANGAGGALAYEILDGGFLELVRLGVRSADDPHILDTLKVYESPSLGIADEAPGFASGALAYRRYNRDGYGSRGRGGYWPLLAGERGMHALAQGDLARARAQLQVLESSQLPSGLIPEQTLEARGGIGPGVACPLVWAHAEQLILRRSLEEGSVFDAPSK